MLHEPEFTFEPEPTAHGMTVASLLLWINSIQAELIGLDRFDDLSTQSQQEFDVLSAELDRIKETANVR